MLLAQEAAIAVSEGNLERSKSLCLEALPLEKEAAQRIPKVPESEPTRSILYKSASSLAYKGGRFEEAIQLLGEALSGWPNAEVRGEILSLYEQINLGSHLELAGLELSSHQVQLSFAGNAIGYGQALYPVIRDRLNAFLNVVGRTGQRLYGMPFASNRGARLSGMDSLISVPRPGSFALTIEIAQRIESQMNMFADGERIIEEVLRCAAAFQDGSVEALEDSVGDDLYFDNLVGWISQLAPDGENVKLVGLTSPSRDVALTKIGKEIAPSRSKHILPIIQTFDEDSFRTVRGTMMKAVSDGSDLIGIRLEDNRVMDFYVSEGMAEIVRSNFNELVDVDLVYTRRGPELIFLRRVD
jgi:hypothetical protein